MPESAPEPATPPEATLSLPLSALIGAVVGLVTALSLEQPTLWATAAKAILPLVWAAGLGAVFLPTARQRWGAVALGGLLCVFGILQVNLFLFESQSYKSPNETGWTLITALGIAGLLLLSGWQKNHFQVRLIPPFAVHSLLIFVMAGLLGGLFYWLVLLATELLNAIGINGPSRWVTEEEFFLPLLLGASAFFVSALRIQPWGLNLTRTLATVLGFLLPVAAGIVLLFALALPYAALQNTAKLYSGFLSSSLYLTLTLAFGVLTVAAFSARPIGLPPLAQTLSRLAAYLLPLFPALALYGLSVRIGQYGLTQERLLGLLGSIWLLLSALALSLTRYAPAFAGLSRVTAGSLALLAAFALAFSVPGLRPMELSARSQAARLTKDNLTSSQSAEIVRQLAYNSGNLGKTLLARIPDDALSEAARKQRSDSIDMSYVDFRRTHQTHMSIAFRLTAASAPLTDQQQQTLRQLLERERFSQPARAHAIPTANGLKVLVYGYSWQRGLWADLTAAGQMTASGRFIPTHSPLQEIQADTQNPEPFSKDTKVEMVTLPAVKVGGTTLLLQEDK